MILDETRRGTAIFPTYLDEVKFEHALARENDVSCPRAEKLAGILVSLYAIAHGEVMGGFLYPQPSLYTCYIGVIWGYSVRRVDIASSYDPDIMSSPDFNACVRFLKSLRSAGSPNTTQWCGTKEMMVARTIKA